MRVPADLATMTGWESAAPGDAFALGAALADRALAQGADALLDAIRGELPT